MVPVPCREQMTDEGPKDKVVRDRNEETANRIGIKTERVADSREFSHGDDRTS